MDGALESADGAKVLDALRRPLGQAAADDASEEAAPGKVRRKSQGEPKPRPPKETELQKNLRLFRTSLVRMATRLSQQRDRGAALQGSSALASALVADVERAQEKLNDLKAEAEQLDGEFEIPVDLKNRAEKLAEDLKVFARYKLPAA